MPMPPLVDIEVKEITINELTTGVVGGEGVFDKLMATAAAHLRGELEAGRIQSNDYTKVYIAGMESAMGTALQFLLQKDQIFWQAALGRQDAILKEQTMPILLEQAAKQLELVEAQVRLQEMQGEVANAQISDFKLDGVTPIAGTVGAQKQLYERQRETYKLDTEIKYVKMLLDGWITQKTIDEELAPPTSLVNTQIDVAFNALRDNLDM